MRPAAKQLFIVVFLFVFANTFAQKISPSKLGWKQYTLFSKQTGTVNFFVTEKEINKKKPVLLYLDGSGAYPLFQFTVRGIGSTVPIDYKKLAEKYHVILISKPGVPFIDSVKMDARTGYPIYKTPEEYNKKLSLDWRVNSANLVLSEISKNLLIDKSKIAVLGISEGFQVGAKLIALNKKITCAALLVGNGLSQFFDFIIQNRIDAQSGLIPDSVAQINIDSLMRISKAIYSDPKSTDKQWFGHTYLRWSSFCQSKPIDNILSINIPVCIVAASKDRNSSVLSTDYLYLESLRLNKTNVTYKVYPYDHSFNEIKTDEKGNIQSVKNHTREIVEEAIEWINRK